jgi:hypothetical protein
LFSQVVSVEFEFIAQQVQIMRPGNRGITLFPDLFQFVGKAEPIHQPTRISFALFPAINEKSSTGCSADLLQPFGLGIAHLPE